MLRSLRSLRPMRQMMPMEPMGQYFDEADKLMRLIWPMKPPRLTS
jgi:hypothetical protein